MKVTIDNKEYTATITKVVGKNEHEVVVQDFEFKPYPRGNGATAHAQIQCAKENFKRQVEGRYDVEVVWG